MHIVASKSNFRQNATYALLPGQRRYAEFVYFAALLHKNNHHVHHLMGCSKKKSKQKKIRPTHPISKKYVTGNIKLIFLGFINNDMSGY